jgi:hypothetical protein
MESQDEKQKFFEQYSVCSKEQLLNMLWSSHVCIKLQGVAIERAIEDKLESLFIKR